MYFSLCSGDNFFKLEHFWCALISIVSFVVVGFAKRQTKEETVTDFECAGMFAMPRQEEEENKEREEKN